MAFPGVSGFSCPFLLLCNHYTRFKLFVSNFPIKIFYSCWKIGCGTTFHLLKQNYFLHESNLSTSSIFAETVGGFTTGWLLPPGPTLHWTPLYVLVAVQQGREIDCKYKTKSSFQGIVKIPFLLFPCTERSSTRTGPNADTTFGWCQGKHGTSLCRKGRSCQHFAMACLYPRLTMHGGCTQWS